MTVILNLIKAFLAKLDLDDTDHRVLIYLLNQIAKYEDNTFMVETLKETKIFTIKALRDAGVGGDLVRLKGVAEKVIDAQSKRLSK